MEKEFDQRETKMVLIGAGTNIAMQNYECELRAALQYNF